MILNSEGPGAGVLRMKGAMTLPDPFKNNLHCVEALLGNLRINFLSDSGPLLASTRSFCSGTSDAA